MATPPARPSVDPTEPCAGTEDAALRVESRIWRSYSLVASLAAALLCVGSLLAGVAFAHQLGLPGDADEVSADVMRGRTAVCLLLLAAAVAWHAAAPSRQPSRGVLLLGVIAAGMALLSTAEPMLGPPLRLLARWPPTAAYPDGAPSGRMPLAIALSIVLLAASLRALQASRARPPASRANELCTVLACLAIALPYLTLLSLLYDHGTGTPALPGVRTVTLSASTGVLLLATAILALQPVQQVYGPRGAASAGGRFFRTVLPMTLLFPAVLNWLRLWGNQAGWYDGEAGVVGTVLVSTGLLFSAALLSTRWIGRFERALWAHRTSLQHEVAQRTAELEASREQLRAVIDTVTTAIISIDASHRIVLFNAAAERIFGLPAGQMLGQPLDRLLPERFRARHAHDVQAFDRAGSTTRLMDAGARLRGLRGNGEEFPIEASISRVDVGGHRLMTVMLRDMSDLEALEAERRARLAAEEARRTQSRFLSHLSHELRTPLNAVIGYAQLQLADPRAGEPATRQRYAHHILAAGRQQLAMISDLLELSRVESEPLPATASVDAAQVVRDGIEQVRGLADKAGIHLHWAAPPQSEMPVYADAARLCQALVNLLANAIKYNRPAGDVTVSLSAQDTEVRIEVSDTGPGLSASQLEHLFEPFNRLGREGGAIEGTGIGLTLSRRLVEQFGGRIEVHSVPDMGSTFTLVLRRAGTA